MIEKHNLESSTMAELEVMIKDGINEWIETEMPKPGYVDGPW